MAESAQAAHSAINVPATARELQDRIETIRGGAAFRNYEYARERVFEMRARAAQIPEARPSAYWAEELANFEYMLDASPLVIDKLRHHSHHLTGLFAHSYRSHRNRQRVKFAEKLRELQKVGNPELLVPEGRLLGGFGFEIDGQLINIDTLKFFEVLIALDKGAVLQEFRGNAERRLVWEIGAGWGGFPYQFKSLCPNVTYVISDFPELFLFSATYLMTVFPGTRVAFWGEQPSPLAAANWREYDFIFMPNYALDELRPERLDLTINMVSFQEMTGEQVARYVGHAYALNCPFLYSLNRERSAYNPEIDSVSAIIARFYWPREIGILHVPYTRMLDSSSSQDDYKHIIGWRRVKRS
jgi:putative sugar O-methyltransferase